MVINVFNDFLKSLYTRRNVKHLKHAETFGLLRILVEQYH